MKRRSFLKSAAAMFPAASFESFALAQAAAPAAEPHIVLSGEDCEGESHSRGFSRILFKVLPSQTNSGLFILEHTHLSGLGPPLHSHFHQEEWFYVVEGEMLFQVGDQRKHLHAGDSVLGPRGIPHTFASAGEKPARMIIAFTPAGKMEEFLRATAIPNPPVQDEAFFARYGMKLLGPSPLAS